MTQAETSITEFPVWPLNELYRQEGSKDLTAKAAISQLVQSLVEFGVSPADVEHHLKEEVKELRK